MNYKLFFAVSQPAGEGVTFKDFQSKTKCLSEHRRAAEWLTSFLIFFDSRCGTADFVVALSPPPPLQFSGKNLPLLLSPCVSYWPVTGTQTAASAVFCVRACAWTSSCCCPGRSHVLCVNWGSTKTAGPSNSSKKQIVKPLFSTGGNADNRKLASCNV